MTRPPRSRPAVRTVALVVPGADGGIVAHSRSLLHRLPALGWRVRVCAPASVLGRLVAGHRAAPGGVELVAVRQGAALAGVDPLRAVDPRSRADLGAALAGVDLVSAQGLRAAVAVLGAGTGPGSRGLVVTLHNPAPASGAGGRLAQVAHRRVMRRATVVLAASADLLAGARAAGARDARLLEVAAPVIAAGDPGRAAAVRATLDPTGRGLLLCAGRLAPQKDHALALDALARMDPDRRPVLVIAGDGPLRPALAAAAAARRLPVRLLGERGDVPDLLAAATAAVLCSRWEARSLFAQEALRAGVPLVVTGVGALPDLVGDAAEIVPAGDPAALAAALDRVLHDEPLRHRLRLAGPARSTAWPTEDDTAAATAAALDRASVLAWDSVER